MDCLNPWDAANCIQAFSFYCCPGCVYRSKSEGDFQIHATFNHPEAKLFFDRLEGRIDTEYDTQTEPVVDYDVDVLQNLKKEEEENSDELQEQESKDSSDLLDQQPNAQPVHLEPNAFYAVFDGDKLAGIIHKVKDNFFC